MISKIIQEIKSSLCNKNYYVSLISSLTLIDIVTSIENNGSTSGTKFANWFEANLSNKYKHRTGHNSAETIFLNGLDCYALRCSILHNGSDFTGQQNKSNMLERFRFTNEGAHCNLFNFGNTGKSELNLSVKDFCEDIIDAVSKCNYLENKLLFEITDNIII